MKINFTYIVIAVLAVIILLQRSCNNNVVTEGSVTTKYDTIWKVKHDTIIKEVAVTHVGHKNPPKGPEYTPGENIDTCRARFNHLLKQHTLQRVYTDTIKLDTLGTITVIDTVWLNKLGKRTKIFNYKIPIVTKTITKPADPVRQLYIGGNMFGDKSQLQLITPGILYKTKKDHIYQANIGVNFDGSITYGLGAYWKIRLKK